MAQWVGGWGCFWDSGTLTIYQTMFSNILQSFSKSPPIYTILVFFQKLFSYHCLVFQSMMPFSHPIHNQNCLLSIPILSQIKEFENHMPEMVLVFRTSDWWQFIKRHENFKHKTQQCTTKAKNCKITFTLNWKLLYCILIPGKWLPWISFL